MGGEDGMTETDTYVDPALPTFGIGTWLATGVDADGTLWVLETVDGWDDTPGVRLDLPNRPGADGAFDAPGRYDAREITLTGVAIARDRTSMQRAKRKLTGLASDLVKGSTLLALLPDGSFQTYVKRSDTWNIAALGDLAFRYQMVLVAPDPTIYSGGDINTVVTQLSSVNPGTGGPWRFSMRFNYGFTGSIGGQGAIQVTNDGNAPTWPTFKVQGPGTNLTIADPNTGSTLTLSQLAATDFVVLDSKNRQVLYMGNTPRRDMLAAGSQWFSIPPGTTVLRFYAATFTSATVTTTWRSAWQ
jgi:hypothetical protein